MFKFKKYINRLERDFSYETQSFEITFKEFLILIFGSYSKKILDLLIFTFSGKQGITNLLSHIPVLNQELFWIIILKILIGTAIFYYFFQKYKGTKAMWYITIYWTWSIGLRMLEIFQTENTILLAIKFLIHGLIFFGQFFFFFGIDKTNIDSLKLLIYDNLEFDSQKERIVTTPWSKVSKSKMLINAQIAVVVMILELIAYSILDAIIHTRRTMINGNGSTKNQETIKEISQQSLIYLAFSSIIIAPIVEELVFRKCLMKLGGCKWWTVPSSAFIFGILHLHTEETLLLMIPYFIAGLFLALTFKSTQNIWHCIITHALHNSIAFVNLVWR